MKKKKKFSADLKYVAAVMSIGALTALFQNCAPNLTQSSASANSLGVASANAEAASLVLAGVVEGIPANSGNMPGYDFQSVVKNGYLYTAAPATGGLLVFHIRDHMATSAALLQGETVDYLFEHKSNSKKLVAFLSVDRIKPDIFSSPETGSYSKARIVDLSNPAAPTISESSETQIFAKPSQPCVVSDATELAVKSEDGFSQYRISKQGELIRTLNAGLSDQSISSAQLTNGHAWGCQIQGGYLLVRLMSNLLLFEQ